MMTTTLQPMSYDTFPVTPDPIPESVFLKVDRVSKIYPSADGPVTVLDNISLDVQEGEFVCIIGHSGCGKSTLVNMVSGFNRPTSGQVTLQDRPITEPGPDRMMVFQNYCLLPWLTVYENVYLAVDAVYQDKTAAAKRSIVMDRLKMVGLTEAIDKRPAQISGGMKQRVAIARALSIQPQVLILDEPFGALDAITKEELQDELLEIWRQQQVTVLMITHDIDEALYLSDRLVMMTNGPNAQIGEIMDIGFARPRDRAAIMSSSQYVEMRNSALDFLYNRYAHLED
jgi:nitrate/nitrite transport system ATP-binding protein